MDKQKKSGTVLSGTFTTSANELEQMLRAETLEMQKINTTWNILQNKYEELRVLNVTVHELMLDTNPEKRS